MSPTRQSRPPLRYRLGVDNLRRLRARCTDLSGRPATTLEPHDDRRRPALLKPRVSEAARTNDLTTFPMNSRPTQNRNELYADKVFAGLASVILTGLLVESLGSTRWSG